MRAFRVVIRLLLTALYAALLFVVSTELAAFIAAQAHLRMEPPSWYWWMVVGLGLVAGWLTSGRLIPAFESRPGAEDDYTYD